MGHGNEKRNVKGIIRKVLGDSNGDGEKCIVQAGESNERKKIKKTSIKVISARRLN